MGRGWGEAEARFSLKESFIDHTCTQDSPTSSQIKPTFIGLKAGVINTCEMGAQRGKQWGSGVACSSESRGPGLCSCPQLFAVGGFDGLRRLRSVERYDPFSNTWAAIAPLPEAVSSAAVAPCAGQLYVIGGAGQDGVNTDKVGSGFMVRGL